MAIFIPAVFVGIFQAKFYQFSMIELSVLTLIGGVLIFQYVLRFLHKFDDMAWKQQLSSVIQKMSSPVLVADLNHSITYANDSFQRLPIAALLGSLDNLADIMAVQENKLNNTVKETLDGLVGKMKCQMQWQGKTYSCVLIPLLSPIGERWGTLLECQLLENNTKIDDSAENVPSKSLLEQLTVPFLYVNNYEDISYVNLKLKELFVRHQETLKAICPHLDGYEPKLSIRQFLSIIQQEDKSFSDIKQLGSLIVHLDEMTYQLSISPIWGMNNDRQGTLVLWQEISKQNLPIQETAIHNALSEMALKQTSHPIVIIDKHYFINQASSDFEQLIHQGTESVDDTLLGKNVLELIEKSCPNIAEHLKQALKCSERSLFVGEHFKKVCDWIITPIKNDTKIEGYILEIMYPSKQELLALEEKNQRLVQGKFDTEKELRQFTQGLANLKLYQKGKELPLEELNVEDYQHPLLKNSSKIMQQIRTDLQNLHAEIDNAKLTQTNSKAYIAPLQQVNALSTSLCLNVNDAQQDFFTMHQELSKLKTMLNEQKGLNQSFVKPIGKAFQSTEQALVKTVAYSESVTLILQQIHENQNFLSQLQEFMAKLAKIPGNAEKTNDIYNDIISLLDRVKKSLAVSKLKLKELLMNFDGLNDCWKQAQENLHSCLHMGTSIEQATKRWGSISNSAFDVSQEIQTKVGQLITLAQKIQTQSTITESINEAVGYQESASRHFEQMVIEVDDSKKMAEDVLLEGISR